MLEIEFLRPSWHRLARCRGQGVEQFFPPAGSQLEVEAVCARFCRPCPVRVECLTAALGNVDLKGVWGGTSAWERRRALRRGLTPEETIEMVDAA